MGSMSTRQGSVIFIKMDKLDERAVIQHFKKRSIASKTIHDDMVATLGEKASSYVTVKGGQQNSSVAVKS